MMLTDGRPSAPRAIEHARRFGLPVFLGVTAGDPARYAGDGVWPYPIVWDDDFAGARTRLRRHVRADFILSLDDDEMLVSFPEIDWSAMDADLYGVRLQDAAPVTPRTCLRLYRKQSSVRWTGRLLNMLRAENRSDQADWRMLPSVVIRHEGYDDPRPEVRCTMGHMTQLDTIVQVDQEILGGTPVFRGTRVPVKNLLDYLAAGDTLDQFLDDFPTVKRGQAVAALELARDLLTARAHPAR